MYKLKDIISSGGTNPKINKAIDRYELSKDEKKDIINTIKNAQQGGGDESNQEYEYIDLRNVDAIDSKYAVVTVTAYLLNIYIDAGIASMQGVLSSASVMKQIDSVTQVKGACIDMSAKALFDGRNLNTAKEFILKMLTQEEFDAIPRITKEEFYNLQ